LFSPEGVGRILKLNLNVPTLSRKRMQRIFISRYNPAVLVKQFFHGIPVIGGYCRTPSGNYFQQFPILGKNDYGFEVYHARVSFAADVGTRAKDLRKEILKILERSDHKKVHIIAHSMGGPDARYMIVREAMRTGVFSLSAFL